jgi:hypothetical protein
MGAMHTTSIAPTSSCRLFASIIEYVIPGRPSVWLRDQEYEFSVESACGRKVQGGADTTPPESSPSEWKMLRSGLALENRPELTCRSLRACRFYNCGVRGTRYSLILDLFHSPCPTWNLLRSKTEGAGSYWKSMTSS